MTVARKWPNLGHHFYSAKKKAGKFPATEIEEYVVPLQDWPEMYMKQFKSGFLRARKI